MQTTLNNFLNTKKTEEKKPEEKKPEEFKPEDKKNDPYGILGHFAPLKQKFDSGDWNEFLEDDEEDEPKKEEIPKIEVVVKDKVKPEEVKPEEVKPEEPEEVKPEEVKSEEVKPEEESEIIEKKKYISHNKKKYIDDEAEDDEEDDEYDGEDNEYEEDEGEDDEGELDDELNIHRNIKFEKKTKLLKVEKKENEEFSYYSQDTSYKKNSFVVSDDEDSNLKSVKNLKDELAQLDDKPLLKKKRKLVKKKVDSDSDSDVYKSIRKNVENEQPKNIELKKTSNLLTESLLEKKNFETMPRQFQNLFIGKKREYDKKYDVSTSNYYNFWTFLLTIFNSFNYWAWLDDKIYTFKLYGDVTRKEEFYKCAVSGDFIIKNKSKPLFNSVFDEVLALTIVKQIVYELIDNLDIYKEIPKIEVVVKDKVKSDVNLIQNEDAEYDADGYLVYKDVQYKSNKEEDPLFLYDLLCLMSPKGYLDIEFEIYDEDNLRADFIDALQKLVDNEKDINKVIKIVNKLPSYKGDLVDIIEMKKFLVNRFNLNSERLDYELKQSELIQYITSDGKTIMITREEADKINQNLERANEIKLNEEKIKKQKENEQALVALDNKNQLEFEENYKRVLDEQMKVFLDDIKILDEENDCIFDEEKQDAKYFNKSNYKADGCSFGAVIYMEKDKYYNDSNEYEKNLNIHMCHYKEIIGLGLLKAVEKRVGSGKILREFIINHEHGDKTCKCHMQCFLKFGNRIRSQMRPGKFCISGITYLYMFQKATFEPKLRNYCKKQSKGVNKFEKFADFKFEDNETIGKYLSDRNLIELKPYEKNVRRVFGQESKLVDVMRQQDITADDLIAVVRDDETPVQERLYIIGNMNKILQFHNDYIAPKPVLSYKWNFPDHAEELINKINMIPPNRYYELTSYKERELKKIFSLIKSWFMKYCIMNDPLNFDVTSRKKGLLIHGPRGIGKTLFCQSLITSVNLNAQDSPFIVYCKGSIVSDEFETKKDTAQLVMLDDVTFVQNQKQMIKALIVGASTRIRSLHNDKFLWSRSCPCIILTNELSTFYYMANSDEFKNDLYSISIEEPINPDDALYLGPPGTMPNDRFNKPICYVTPGSQGAIDRYKRDKELKKNLFKVNSFNNNI